MYYILYEGLKSESNEPVYYTPYNRCVIHDEYFRILFELYPYNKYSIFNI